MISLVRFHVLFLAALSAHVLAGGSLVQISSLVWQILCIAATLFCIRGVKLEGPALALTVLFIQSTSHFLLGGGSYQNESRMTLAHCASGYLSYLAITYFEILWKVLTSAAVALVPARPFSRIYLPKLTRYALAKSNATFQIRQLTASLKFRGPPMDWKTQ